MTVTRIEPVTIQEAQFVVDRPLVDINKAIEHGEVVANLVSVTASAAAVATLGGRLRAGRDAAAPRTRTVRTLGTPELVYLALGRDLQASLTPLARRALVKAIGAAPDASGEVSVGAIQVRLKEARARVWRRYRALRDVRTGIVERAGREPVFRGTGIEVYRVAALARGRGIAGAIADYPSLKPRQVQRALDYALAYPKRGRPYPATGLKQALGALADSGVFDLPVDEEERADG